jgi:hypothetical protein
MIYVFDEIGHCENPSVEFSFNGKYITVRIMAAIISNLDTHEYVFGTYFRGAYSYIGEACKDTSVPVPVENKSCAMAKLLKSAISYFESIKYAEVQAIKNSRWNGSDKEIQDTYDKEINFLRKKLSEYLQLNIF